MRDRLFACALVGALACGAGASPWATEVISYAPGATAAPDFDNPQTALGEPTRFTGENVFGGQFAAVVSPFSPPFGNDEIVSIGEGGHLTVRFDSPIRNDPSNPFGVDLIVFANAGFIGSGTVGDPPAMFGGGSAQIEVSRDGVDFFSLGDIDTRLFPTMGYRDGGPFDGVRGQIETDFRTPVDPSLTLNDFAGLSLEQIRGLYGASGGGIPVDVASAMLDEIYFVRLSVADDGDPTTELRVNIDGFAVVPTPGTLGLLGLAAVGMLRRRR